MDNSIEALQKTKKDMLYILPMLLVGINPKDCRLRYKKAPVHPGVQKPMFL
jgi:hypothetical protein